jgi:hypothetical protein
VQDVDVANFALGRLKVGQMIESLDEATTPARQCNRWFAQCRNEVLRDFPWDFALMAEALAEVSEQTFPGWGYVYQYPLDCLAVREVGTEGGIRLLQASAFVSWYEYDHLPRPIRYPFKRALKADKASQVLLTDLPNAWVFFTAEVTNLNVWPEDAISAFAWKLASEVGGPLQAQDALVTRAAQMYEAMKIRAAAASMNESRADREAEGSSILAR